MTTQLAFKPPVTTNIVLLDGLTRAGKLMASRIVSHLKRVDYFMYSPVLEHIAALWRFGLLDQRSATSMLRLNIDVLVYDRMVGRNLNDRPSDATYIRHAADYAEYAARALAPEGMVAMEAFNANKRIALFLTHDLLAQAEICFVAAPYLKMVEVVRHPVEIIHSWYHRGWGARFGIDPLAFTPVAEHNDALMPWFAIGFAAEFGAMTPMERCVASVLALIEANRASLESLDNETLNQIHFVSYEKILRAPREVVDDIAHFLGTEPHDSIGAAIARENLPNPQLLCRRAEKLTDIQMRVSGELFEKLGQAVDEYERRWPQS